VAEEDALEADLPLEERARVDERARPERLLGLAVEHRVDPLEREAPLLESVPRRDEAAARREDPAQERLAGDELADRQLVRDDERRAVAEEDDRARRGERLRDRSEHDRGARRVVDG